VNSASVNEIRKELSHLDSDLLQTLCLRLVKYKKENKELMSYLLFEAHDERAYIQQTQQEIDQQFGELATRNLYLVKKTLRKILRFANRKIKYSGRPQTELEIRIFFCKKMEAEGVPLTKGTVLFNLYQQQRTKIDSVLCKLPEDEQGDYTFAFKTIV
jgi:membrane-anchored protein YejM (alkaline phosphatase superfamily)